DDNATNREIVTRHARSWGMQPVAVVTPAEALALVEAGERFDAAVLDMMMPDTDGLALGEEMRRRTEDQLPLVLLTSLGRLPEAQWTGVFCAQLAKPLKASQLYNALLSALTGDDAALERAAEVKDVRGALSSLRILLAEDNPMNQKVALRLLEQLGYGADVASNGLEALAALERRPYDVVLMDVQMPELDGLGASRRICERWPAENRPRIVAMTANALTEDREACFAAGMDDYVAKPIRSGELATALRRVTPLPSDGEHRAAQGGDGAPGADGDSALVAGADAGPTDAPIGLDAAALESLRELGGAEFLAEVVEVFLADAPALIASVRSSLERRDAEELRRAAHTLKSNAATLGAPAFAELCR
ncbi:MAG: response regulator, partial [Solirubrobacteraceae bacterium]